MKKIYLSGPMSGMAEYNFPAFHAAASKLRARGYDVFNPAEIDNGDTSKPKNYYLAQDIGAVLDCDTLVLISGWKHSSGARLERDVAAAVGKEILELTDDNELVIPASSETILDTAKRLVYGPRQEAYGHPYRDFSRTAVFWSAILGVLVTPQQVALCMCALKLSREVNMHHADNLVDLAGYAATAAMVEDYEAQKPKG